MRMDELAPLNDSKYKKRSGLGRVSDTILSYCRKKSTGPGTGCRADAFLFRTGAGAPLPGVWRTRGEEAERPRPFPAQSIWITPRAHLPGTPMPPRQLPRRCRW